MQGRDGPQEQYRETDLEATMERRAMCELIICPAWVYIWVTLLLPRSLSNRVDELHFLPATEAMGNKDCGRKMDPSGLSNTQGQVCVLSPPV